jgi:hypothetical protein
MAFIIADRVRESSASTGTGNFTLAGAVTGYQTFASVMATSDTTFYTIADQGGSNWEVGIGTFTSPSTLARTTILSSSNGGSVVTFGAGTKDVFISLPASKTNVEDQPNLIEVNSSSAALLITQTGAGNALVVEDSANPDSTPFVVNASGQVLIGRTTAPFGTTQLGIEQIGANTQAAAQDFLKNRAGATIASGDGVGQLRFWGYDGTSNEQVAAITAIAEGTITTGDVPGRIVFSTRQQSTASVSERMRIDSNGNVGIGTSSPTATLSVVANTSSDAVRITQTGAGNALVVEDSANPDATPFVVDTTGIVINGYTTSIATQNYSGFSVAAPIYQQHGNSQSTTTAAFFNWSSSSGSPPNLILNKSVSNVVGTRGALTAASTDIGAISFNGDDGTNFIPAAVILAETDGTPATNDMPGRLIFSTTADGASFPTERMRIDNLGRIGFGGAGAFGNSVIGVRNNMSGFGQTTNYAVRVSATFDSAATSAILSYSTASWTGGAGASPYTTTSVTAYDAATFTLGTNQTVTNLYGFVANSGLTVATNNYGFYSNIASGTGRWNFYAAGTADNYFAGQVQLGAGTAAAPALSTTGDTNTGIFFPAADTVAISAAGTEDFRIGPAGQIGIGGANYGTSGQVLTSNGSAAAPSWASATVTGTLKNVQVFTSSGTYTRTAGVTTAVALVVGGGGGGKGATGKTAGGNGGNGGTSSFGSHVTALGGTGSTGTTGGAGGTGGTGATIAIKGQGGGAGFAFAVGSNIGSLGGSAGGQGGGAGVRSNSAGNAGVRGGGGSGGADTDGTVCAEGSYAGGGGGQGETCIKYITSVGATETVTIGAGGTAGTGTRAGGAGGAGYIIVYEYS